MCQFGARVVQQLLYEFEDEDFEVYVVWEPILRTDKREVAVKATTFIPDSRAKHYWVDDHSVGNLFKDAIGLENEPAWDVYLLYPAGTKWGESPPVPEYFQHQLGGRLPPEKRLNADGMAERIEALLEKLAALQE